MIVYDSGALVAADRGDPRFTRLHVTYLAQGYAPRIPAGVLAQAWRGGPQPLLSRVLGGCVVLGLDATRAKAAGALCGVAGTSDVVDASVVMLAEHLGAAVVTSDVEDLSRLVEATGAQIPLIAL